MEKVSKYMNILLAFVVVSIGTISQKVVATDLGESDNILVTSSVNIADFISFSETDHEAEFIVDLVQEWTNGSVIEEGEDSESDADSFHAKNARKEIVFIFDEQNEAESSTWVPPSLNVLKVRDSTFLQEKITISKLNGKISRGQRVKMTVACSMHLAMFPYDSHLCTLQFMGQGNWSKLTPTSFCGGDDSIQEYQFKLKGYSNLNLNQNKLIVNLIVSRSSSMQIFGQMYSPVITLVILSFFTMWIGTLQLRIFTSLAYLLCLIIIISIFWRDIPRTSSGHQTAIEHYFAISIGLVFQIVFTNVAMYGYQSKSSANGNNPRKYSTVADVADVEAEGDKAIDKKENNNKAKNANVKDSIEEEILKMGKFHRFLYFKCLKPAKHQLPIAFLIINVIYWPIVLFLSSGLPKGFLSVSPTGDCRL